MNPQPPLLPPPAETDTQRDVARLVGILAGRGWMTAAKIMEIEGAWNERQIRKLANASEGVVMSYPGSPGYHLTREASAEERDHAASAIRTRACAMDDRARAICRVHHQHHPGGGNDPQIAPISAEGNSESANLRPSAQSADSTLGGSAA